MRTVNVTAEHIANGRRGDCRSCPVALALRDAGVQGASVGLYFLMWDNKQAVPHPLAVAAFIDRFDRRQPVAPFSFTLPEPDA